MDFGLVGPVIAAALAVAGSAVKALERNIGAALAYAAVALLSFAAAIDNL